MNTYLQLTGTIIAMKKEKNNCSLQITPGSSLDLVNDTKPFSKKELIKVVISESRNLKIGTTINLEGYIDEKGKIIKLEYHLQ